MLLKYSQSTSRWLSEDLMQGKYDGIVAVSSMQLVFDSSSILIKLLVVYTIFLFATFSN